MPKTSVKKYISAFTFINSTLAKNNSPILNALSITSEKEISIIQNVLNSDEAYLLQNKKGNNMYSAAFSNYCKFLRYEDSSTQNSIEDLDTPIICNDSPIERPEQILNESLS